MNLFRKRIVGQAEWLGWSGSKLPRRSVPAITTRAGWKEPHLCSRRDGPTMGVSRAGRVYRSQRTVTWSQHTLRLPRAMLPIGP